MLTVSDKFIDTTNALVRNPIVKVTNGEAVYTHNDAIKSIEIQRIGDSSKFWGYGICQRLHINSIQITDESSFSANDLVNVELGFIVDKTTGEEEYISFPEFKVTEVNKDIDKGELSVTAYDKLYETPNHVVSEIELTTPYTVKGFVEACAALLGVSSVFVNIPDNDINLNLSFDEGANFSGAETIREALDSAAEILQAIYYLNSEGNLTFKRFDKTSAVWIISIDNAFSFKMKTKRRLTEICHTTELGDNVSEKDTITGTTQYIRDNPFWNLRDDIADLLHDAFVNMNGLTITQFEGEWMGNLAVEIGDRIALIDREGVNSGSLYLLNDVITYDGALRQKTEWNYSGSDIETENNPISLGEILKQTTARVDKASQTIELSASKIEENSESISSLLLNTESITASVQQIEENTEANRSELENEIAVLSSKVDATITSENVKIEIQKELANGVSQVTTNTGFTFNDEGLTVDKTNSEMKTTITENGMTVYKNDEAVLTANNTGVDAANLRATTYLIIGTNSRFEDYDGNRTGCFWIGGNS